MPISLVENRDCMQAMSEFPDKYFDLAVVDPPYGISAHKAGLDFWGYELDKDYFEAQEARYKNYLSQLDLFREAI